VAAGEGEDGLAVAFAVGSLAFVKALEAWLRRMLISADA
jgi:hypothetical protein